MTRRPAGARQGLPVLYVYAARRRRLIEAVSAARPGVSLIPAYAAGTVRAEAAYGGADVRGMPRYNTVMLVVAVLRDRLEVWVPKDDQPRWTVMRTGADIGIVRLPIGNSTQPAIRVTDGTRSVSFVPYHEGLGRAARLEKALRDLGEDSTDHLEP